jgi:hypothetical protein
VNSANSANSDTQTEEGEADEEAEEEEEEEGRRKEGRKEGRKEEEDSAGVNHKTTHRGSGTSKSK